MTSEPDYLLPLSEVKKRVSISSATIYRWIQEGKFPLPLKLSSNCVRWRESDINAWIASLPFTDGRTGEE